jgi:hypothetical protein
MNILALTCYSANTIGGVNVHILDSQSRGKLVSSYWLKFLQRKYTFKFKITPYHHNAIQNLIHSLLHDPPCFSYHLPLRSTLA